MVTTDRWVVDFDNMSAVDHNSFSQERNHHDDSLVSTRSASVSSNMPLPSSMNYHCEEDIEDDDFDMMNNFASWEFNTFDHPDRNVQLRYISRMLLKFARKCPHEQGVSTDPRVFQRFCERIMNEYQHNPYHNWEHAVTVGA